MGALTPVATAACGGAGEGGTFAIHRVIQLPPLWPQQDEQLLPSCKRLFPSVWLYADGDVLWYRQVWTTCPWLCHIT